MSMTDNGPVTSGSSPFNCMSRGYLNILITLNNSSDSWWNRTKTYNQDNIYVYISNFWGKRGCICVEPFYYCIIIRLKGSTVTEDETAGRLHGDLKC
jgi:hypothetical protein